jgi:hypothetical protein
VLRKLRVGGRYLVISGNEPGLVLPYIYGTDYIGPEKVRSDPDRPAWLLCETVELERCQAPKSTELEPDGALLQADAGKNEQNRTPPSFSGLQMRMYVLERLP